LLVGKKNLIELEAGKSDLAFFPLLRFCSANRLSLDPYLKIVFQWKLPLRDG